MPSTPPKPPAKLMPSLSGSKTAFPVKAKVKNTFLTFDSPLKTVAVLSPPKTVPSNFAPEVNVDGPLLCTPLAMRTMVHAQTPWTQAVHGGAPPPPPCVSRACPSLSAVASASTAPAAAPAPAPLLRLSDFLPSPVPAAAALCGSREVVATTMATGALHAQEVQSYPVMQGSMDIMPCWQGFECVPPAMPPALPPAMPPVLPPAIPPVPLLPSAVSGSTGPAGFAEPLPSQPPMVSISAGHFPEPSQSLHTVAMVPSPPPSMPAPLLQIGTSVCGGTVAATCIESAPALPPPPVHSSTASLPSGGTSLLSGNPSQAATVGMPPPPPLAPAPLHACPSATQPQLSIPPHMALQPPQHQPTFNAQQVQAAHVAASAAAAALAATGTMGAAVPTASYHQAQATMPLVSIPHQTLQQQLFAEHYATDMVMLSQSIA